MRRASGGSSVRACVTCLPWRRRRTDRFAPGALLVGRALAAANLVAEIPAVATGVGAGRLERRAVPSLPWLARVGFCRTCRTLSPHPRRRPSPRLGISARLADAVVGVALAGALCGWRAGPRSRRWGRGRRTAEQNRCDDSAGESGSGTHSVWAESVLRDRGRGRDRDRGRGRDRDRDRDPKPVPVAAAVYEYP